MDLNKIQKIYDEALDDLFGDSMPLYYGPAHIVWCDHNFDLAEWCLENFDKYKGDFEDWELHIVKRSLNELTKIPKEERTDPDD